MSNLSLKKDMIIERKILMNNSKKKTLKSILLGLMVSTWMGIQAQNGGSDLFKKVSFETFNGYIVPSDYSLGNAFLYSERYELVEEQIREVEAVLKNSPFERAYWDPKEDMTGCQKRKKRRKRRKLAKYYSPKFETYDRQYMGIINGKGDSCILINFVNVQSDSEYGGGTWDTPKDLVSAFIGSELIIGAGDWFERNIFHLNYFVNENRFMFY